MMNARNDQSKSKEPKIDKKTIGRSFVIWIRGSITPI